MERLQELIDSGDIKVVDGSYIGIDRDGQEVSIGGDWDDAAAERYLADCPTPADW